MSTRHTLQRHLVPSDGAYFIDLTGLADHGASKGLALTIVGLEAGAIYALRFDLGIRNGFCSLGIDCAGPVEVSASMAGVVQSFTFDSADPGNRWGSFGLMFVANRDSDALTFTGLSGYRYIGLDNVSVSMASAVPEPAMGALLLAGLAGLAASGTRHQRSHRLRRP